MRPYLAYSKGEIHGRSHSSNTAPKVSILQTAKERIRAQSNAPGQAVFTIDQYRDLLEEIRKEINHE